MAKTETEDRVAAHAVDSSEWIAESAKAAAEVAAQEAEDAGVAAHAVMRSAPDGYATGIGDRWEGIHIPADSGEGNMGTGPDHPSRAKERETDVSEETGKKSADDKTAKASASTGKRSASND